MATIVANGNILENVVENNRVRFTYDKPNHEGLVEIVGTVVKSPRNNPNHLTVQRDSDGQFRSYDPLRVIDWSLVTTPVGWGQV